MPPQPTIHAEFATLLTRLRRAARTLALQADQANTLVLAARARVLAGGLPYREAGVLEVSLGTLTSRLARAREALQGLLSDQARTVA